MAWNRQEREEFNALEDFVNSKLKISYATATELNNIALTPSGGGFDIAEDSLGGITVDLSGQTFLLGGQTNLFENGLYVVNSLSPVNISRSVDFQSFIQINNTVVRTRNGDNSGQDYDITTTEPFVLDSTDINITDSDQLKEDLVNRISKKVDKAPRRLDISDLATGGDLATSAEIDNYEIFVITQTTAAQNITLPAPSPVTAKNIEIVNSNSSTATFSIYGLDLKTGNKISLYYDSTNSQWVIASTGIVNNVFTGATLLVDGTEGLVTKPLAGEQELFLKGDGSWSATPQESVFIGATPTVNGSSGLVPQPNAGQEELFLKGDGTWSTPAGGGGSGAPQFYGFRRNGSNLVIDTGTGSFVASSYPDYLIAADSIAFNINSNGHLISTI